MKINMYGGALTMSYNLAKFLRKKGEDVTLFLDKDLCDKSYLPEWEDEELKGNSYPDWIKVTDAKFDRALFGDKDAKAFVKTLTDCDVLHLHGEAYLWANLFERSFIYHSYGYDLDRMPFRKDNLKSMVLAFLSRRAIRKASKIIAAPYQKPSLEKIGTAEKFIYLPFPIDLDKYKNVDASELRRSILRLYDAEVIFFHPARHEWANSSVTNNKTNDKVIYAFSSYLKRTNKDAVLILVNKGRDVGESKKVIENLGVKEKVLWLDPMPKAKLIEYYNASDVVLDQFNGWFGQIFLEAMACGKPTFIYLKGCDKVYPEEPPAINCEKPDEIVKKLIEVAGSKDDMAAIGEKSRAWIEKYHSWQNACGNYIELYKSMVKGKN